MLIKLGGFLTNEQDDTFEFRMVEAGGGLMKSYLNPARGSSSPRARVPRGRSTVRRRWAGACPARPNSLAPAGWEAPAGRRRLSCRPVAYWQFVDEARRGVDLDVTDARCLMLLLTPHQKGESSRYGSQVVELLSSRRCFSVSSRRSLASRPRVKTRALSTCHSCVGPKCIAAAFSATSRLCCRYEGLIVSKATPRQLACWGYRFGQR
jgi:hypothetical protein